MTELEQATVLANAVLEKPFIDPDGDICMLARQFLRALELLAERDTANEFLRNARDEMEKRWLQAARQRSLLTDTLNEIAARDRQNFPPHGGSIARMAIQEIKEGR